MITLDAKERDKFAFYLKQEAETNENMAELMEKLKVRNKAMTKRMMMQALFCIIMANDLLRVEENKT